jgi:hypothetical protein
MRPHRSPDALAPADAVRIEDERAAVPALALVLVGAHQQIRPPRGRGT